MKATKQILTITLVLTMQALLTSCCHLGEIRTSVKDIAKIDVPEDTDDIIVPNHSMGFAGTGSDRVELFEEQKKLTRNLEEIVAFDPNADSLYAGALVQGSSLPNGVLSPISASRSGVTITIPDLNPSDSNKVFSVSVSQPTLQSITEAINKILSQNLVSNQPARVSYTKTTANSIDEGMLRLGASFSWMAGHVSGSFLDSSTNSQSSFLVRFVQTYYTVTCDAPSDPASFFTCSTDAKSLLNYMGKDNPPAYIASVTYGRELWMYIQSSHNASEVAATLDAAFSAVAASGSLNLNSDQTKVLNESSIQILAIGGSGAPAVKLIAGNNISQLSSYLLSGADFSSKSPGVPISYVARYLKDNDVAKVSASTQYTIKTSQNAPEPEIINSVQVIWHTTGDGKDWNTQANIDVYDRNGRKVAHLDCCSADRQADKWDAPSSQTRTLNILVPNLALADLSHGSFAAWRVPNGGAGNDDWDYQATVFVSTSLGRNVTLGQNAGRNSVSANW